MVHRALGLLVVLLAVSCGSKAVSTSPDSASASTDVHTGDTGPATYEPQIVVEPDTIDFGELTKGCTSPSQTVSIGNSGTYPLRVLSVDIDDDTAFRFSADVEDVLIAPDDALDVITVDFVPPGEATYAATVSVRSDDPDDWNMDITLTGVGTGDQRLEETFIQAALQPIDVLFVFEASNSDIGDLVDDLALELRDVFARWDDLGVDWQVGVLPIDMSSPTYSGRLAALVSAGDPDGDSTFLAAVDAMTRIGLDDHQTFSTVEAALSEPLISTDNQGFLRSTARLSVFAYTDTDDESPGSAADFVAFLRTLSTVDPNFSAISGPTGGFLGCFGLFGPVDSADPAPRLGSAIVESGGEHMSICDTWPAQAAGIIDQHATGQQTDFALAEAVTVDDWIEVSVDGVAVVRDGSDGWTYVDSGNLVRFHGSAIPGPGAEILVAYPSPVPCP